MAKASKKRPGYSRSGITRVVTIILLAVGLVAAGGGGSLLRAKAHARRIAEITTMRRIAAAYEQYAIDCCTDFEHFGTRTIGPSGTQNEDIIGPGNFLKTTPTSVYDSNGNFTVGTVGYKLYVRSPRLPGTFTLSEGYVAP